MARPGVEALVDDGYVIAGSAIDERVTIVISEVEPVVTGAAAKAVGPLISEQAVIPPPTAKPVASVTAEQGVSRLPTVDTVPTRAPVDLSAPWIASQVKLVIAGSQAGTEMI